MTESELLDLLGSRGDSAFRASRSALHRLPLATWSPLRSALEEGLVDHGGILNFAHEFLRSAVEAAFVAEKETRDEFRLRLAGYFEGQPVSARSCDELSWLLWQTEERGRLRSCLLNIDRFLEIRERDQEELLRYLVWLGEERAMGQGYLASFEGWADQWSMHTTSVGYAANQLACFLKAAALYSEAERLCRSALATLESSLGACHPDVTIQVNNLAQLLKATGRWTDAEPLMWRVLASDVRIYGAEHPKVATRLNNVAQLLQVMGRLAEAEPLVRKALAVDEANYGSDHPDVARDLNNLASLLQATNRLAEAEPLMRRALAIVERTLGSNHVMVARTLNNLAQLLQVTNRLAEAEPLMRRALAIFESSLGADHPNVATQLNNLATLLQDTNRLAEAEPLMRRALAIDEGSFGPDHPKVAIRLNNLAQLLQDTNRLAEAEPLMRRMVEIFIQFTRATGHPHPHLQAAVTNYAVLLMQMGTPPQGVVAKLQALGPEAVAILMQAMRQR